MNKEVNIQKFPNLKNNEIEKQKEYFIETLVHDLKVPTLAQYRGLELLENEVVGNLNEEQKELVSQIKYSCKYILDMISMLLNTYRIESGQMCLVYENFSLAELVLESFEDMSPLVKDKNLTLVYAATEDDTNLRADKRELKRVIMNLILNAIMYSRSGEKIEVTVKSCGNELKVSVKSMGITLLREQCVNIFEKINNKNSKFAPIGHGISLYLCQRIIDEHNGKFFVSTDGRRTNEFTFIVPKYQFQAVTRQFSPAFI